MIRSRTTWLAAALFVATPAFADEASGTWTGELTLRTNYYWETSTRVVAPEVHGTLVSPDGTRIDADYLVDAITSASIAAGVQEDIRFTEVRHQATAGISREFDLGEAQLRLGTSSRVSFEPDYVATYISFNGALALNQRSTVLNLALTYVHDDVGAVLRGGMPRVDPVTGRDLSDRGRQGQLEGVTLVGSWSQALSPVATLTLGYQLLHNWGFLHNPYRRARVAGALDPEVHPQNRLRHTLSGRFAYFVPETRTAFHLMYRAYVDDWSIAALSPEVRVYQLIGSSVMVRARWRYYAQTDAFFYEDAYDVLGPFVTADPKMSGFDSHLLGAQVRVALDFLTPTALEFLSRGWVDVSFNYWWQTSRFGDGILAQAGFTTPF